jgi:SAM-dependent methyltransferase
MDKNIDFDLVAPWYDAYVQVKLDRAFWVAQARQHPGARLELMCGTGRLSLPILRAGMELTCVDYSAGLLSVFREKLAAAGLKARVLHRDVRDLGLSGFDYAFIGFHSFSELLTRQDQLAALRSIRSALVPAGTLALSLHNPVVRGPQLDGRWRGSGPFPLPGGGRLEMKGRYFFDPDAGLVVGAQAYKEYDAGGVLLHEVEMPMQFRLPGVEELEALATEAGFAAHRWWGDYQGGPFVPERSPFIICELRKRGAGRRLPLIRLDAGAYPMNASHSASAAPNVTPNACANRCSMRARESSRALARKNTSTRSRPNRVIRNARNEPASR